MARSLSLSISKAQVKNSPDFDSDMPVSRQNEVDVLDPYGYPTCWDGCGMSDLTVGGADLVVLEVFQVAQHLGCSF